MTILEKSGKITRKIEKAEMKASRLPPAEFTEEQLCSALCRESFYDFVQEFWSVIVPEEAVWNWHIKFICDELQQMAERVFKGLPKEHDLTVNVSPGSSKTLILSIMFPAWVWTRMRTARIITASYSYDIAVASSLKSRDLIESEKYRALFPEVQLREDQNAKNHYMTKMGGERYAFGIGGAVTGKHAHFIIVDDPLNPSQAFSSAELQATNRWMEETLPSRKVNKLVTPTILIMQRLAENDPTGVRLEKAHKLPHRLICLPAELAENISPPECRRYYVDGLMDPVRLPYEVLQEIEETQGSFVLASQYGQSPIPRGGLMFMTHKLIIEKPPKRFKKLIRAWDKAGTAGGGNYTVGVKMGEDYDGHYWVLHVVRGQWDSGARERIIRETAKEDGRGVEIVVEEEPGSGGKQSAQGSVRNLAGFRVRAHKVGKSDGDKEQRADAFSAQVNVGNVYLAKAPWNEAFIHEMKFFPRSKHKDQVDAASSAFNHVAVVKRIAGGRSVRNKLTGL